MKNHPSNHSMSRRTFGKNVVLGVSVTLLSSPCTVTRGLADSSETNAGSDPLTGSWNSAFGASPARADGHAKVTGAKVYAADFRAKDLPGWPKQTGQAMLLRADRVKQVFAGIDLDALDSDLMPDKVVLASDIAAADLQTPGFYKGDLLCPVGTGPLYLGQPVALLIWNDFERFAAAREFLPPEGDAVDYGAEIEPKGRPAYGANRFVRIAGEKTGSPDVYSPVKSGWVTPLHFQAMDIPVWQRPLRDGDEAEQASYWGRQIQHELDNPASETLVLDQSFTTQSVDHVFMEPENGLAWYDPENRKLSFMVGSQSPADTAESVAHLLAAARPGKVESVEMYPAYMGGGFGGRDHSIYPLYVALAGYFANGKPVRLANDRYQQFQSGLKRHAFQIDSRLGVDRATGRMTAFSSDIQVNGGGMENLSMAVVDVGANASLGIYSVPRADVAVTANWSRAIPAGSMRGFGTLQTLGSLEVLVDRAARALNMDPIEFRRRNILTTGDRILTGNALTNPVRSIEILHKLAQHRLWRDRVAIKANSSSGNDGVLRGVGVACAMKNYGGGSDAGLAEVSFSPDGRIRVATNATEMGTGLSTAIARRLLPWFGREADDIHLAALDLWGPLELETSGNPFTMSADEQDRLANNSRWVPEISSATYASIGASVLSEVVAETARALFLNGLWPAAMALWRGDDGNDPASDTPFDPKVARFTQDGLVLPGRSPLSLKRIAAEVYRTGGVTGILAHGFNRWDWARATFDISVESAQTPFSGILDAMAVRRGVTSQYERLERREIQFPDTALQRVWGTYFACSGALISVAIDTDSGEIKVEDAYTVLEAGTVIVPELVSGQAQGGFAMAMGQALYEQLPLYEDGPGNGTWNLDSYRVPRISDLPVWKLETEILPSLGPSDPPKGIAEVVMVQVVPAILNAIADATGHHFNSMPVTPDRVLEVLP